MTAGIRKSMLLRFFEFIFPLWKDMRIANETLEKQRQEAKTYWLKKYRQHEDDGRYKEVIINPKDWKSIYGRFG